MKISKAAKVFLFFALTFNISRLEANNLSSQGDIQPMARSNQWQMLRFVFNYRKYPLWGADNCTLKINDKGYIVELGKKPINYGEIQGQYIGLIKFRIDIISKIKDYYNSLDKNKLYDGNDFDNMYMTSFLQLISRDIAPLSPVFIDNGWIEVDTPSDLKLTKFINNN